MCVMVRQQPGQFLPWIKAVVCLIRSFCKRKGDSHEGLVEVNSEDFGTHAPESKITVHCVF